MPENDYELASVIAQLRQQLQEAIAEGKDEDLRFKVQEIEVELKCSLKSEDGVGGGVKFWVINADAKTAVSEENVQTVKLKLLPLGKDNEPTLLSDVDDSK